MRFIIKTTAIAACLLLSTAAGAAEVVKIAHIDPMSGPFALVGESFGRHLEQVAAEGGVESVQPMIDGQQRYAVLAAPLAEGDVFTRSSLFVVRAKHVFMTS